MSEIAPNHLLIYCEFITERMIYTFDFITKPRKITYQITNDFSYFSKVSDAAKLVYASIPHVEHIPNINPAKLLVDDGIEPYEMSIDLFSTEKCLSFDGVSDPVASIFYVLTRYEEYLSHPEDEHGRFLSTSSIQHQNDWLNRPMADVWATELLKFVKQFFPFFVYDKPSASLRITFDIDNTFAFKHKSFLQTFGGRIKDVFSGNAINKDLRYEVRSGNIKDPYDTFDDILKYYNNDVPVQLFWHLGDFNKFDRNISWTNQAHQRLIQRMGSFLEIGSHPSYHSFLNERLVRQERGRLEHILGRPVLHSRQHFLRVKMPETYQLLTKLGYRHEHSMGYADAIGFRMGTAHAFPFYDLNKDEPTNLMIHPFVYMDGSLQQYLKLDIQDAKLVIDDLYNQVQEYGGEFICIWHNHTINDQFTWEGWRSVLDYTVQKFGFDGV